jgi:hypothetical protein
MKKTKQTDYRELDIFKEFSDLSREPRESIQQMKRYYRFDVGDEIRRLLREIKYKISDINSSPNNCKLEKLVSLCSLLNHLEIALSDCIEEGSLSLKGRYNINLPLSRLANVKTQATNWENYIEDKYSQ